MEMLVQELNLYHGRFRTYFRMSVGHFEEFLEMLAPYFKRLKRNFTEVIVICLIFVSRVKQCGDINE